VKASPDNREVRTHDNDRANSTRTARVCSGEQ